jgi:rare lipoprotein A
MKRMLFLIPYISGSLFLASLLSSCGRGNVPLSVPYVQYGLASWYGKEFHGRRTANGEIYDMFQLTAAHRSAPLGIHAIVTNLDTGRSVRVRINDRGPFVANRILDLSYAAARRLGMLETGLVRVKIQFLPETLPTPTFVVQAGAYTEQDNATRAQRALATRYPQVWITTAREGSQTFYRVRLGTFPNRAAAERVAREVRALGYAARVVPLS